MNDEDLRVGLHVFWQLNVWRFESGDTDVMTGHIISFDAYTVTIKTDEAPNLPSVIVVKRRGYVGIVT